MHEHTVVTDDVAGNAQPQEVRVQSLKLGGDNADILTTLGHLNAVYLLNAHCVCKGVGVGADTADALNQNQGLDGVALGSQLLNATVVVAYKDFSVLDNFALGVELSVDGLFKRRMVRSNRNYIAHLFPPDYLMFFSTSSFRGVTIIWPLP